MSDEEQVLIPINDVTISFNEHLELPDNKRVLFSAPFGAGKSFFLNEYFSQNVNLLSIRLHPVDYSVANNEDIFELMKHDIINALIEKYSDSLKLDKEDFSKLMLAQEFLRRKMEFTGIAKAIFTAIVPNGEALIKVVDEVKKINDEFNDFSTQINSDQEKLIKDYLVDLKNRKGSIRENDAITLIIKDYVKRIKEANEGRRFVFIIDDLDRLDPDHLFRLFNVFTAHHDSKTDSNKFDFDQLIFVCDVKNIHHMFRHKYGKKVDFSGYIDKFYSSHIFYFDFKKYLKESIKKLLMKKYFFDKEVPSGLTTYIYDRYDFKNKAKARDWGDILKYIIGNFIDYDLIKIRSFERFQSYRLPGYEFEYLTGRKNNAYDYYFLVLTHILQQFFPRLYEYEQALEGLSKAYVSDYSPKEGSHYFDNSDVERWLIQISLPFLMEPSVAFGRGKEQNNAYFEYKNEHGDPVELYYSVNYDGLIQFTNLKILQKIEPDIVEAELGAGSPEFKSKTSPESVLVKQPNPYWFLLEAFKKAHQRGFLKA